MSPIRPFFLAFGVLAAACATPQPAPPKAAQPVTTGRMLAQAACPVRITEADAWVDYMPGPSRGARQVHVSARLEKPGDTAMLLRSSLTTRDALYLEVRATSEAARPGELDYREDAPSPVFKRVVFLCRGGEVFSVEAVKAVY